jgi:hypothetical protein
MLERLCKQRRQVRMLDRSSLAALILNSFRRERVRAGGPMPELIADLDRTVIEAATGDEYFVNVAGEQLANGTWEGWLEFVPLTDALPIVTGAETQQHRRSDLEWWADRLSDVYLQGAFDRALGRRAGLPAPAVADAMLADPAGVPDPFELLEVGETELRTVLGGMTRATLLAVIQVHGLNPAERSLIRLTDRQLVTFIVTATKVQTGRLQVEGDLRRRDQQV